MAFEFRELRSPDDPDLIPLQALMAQVFADPNLVLSVEQLRRFLGLAQDPACRFHILTVRQEGRLLGGTIFDYLPGPNCGFSEYIMLAAEARGRGLGRRLFAERKQILDADARAHGHAACTGLFIETENPDRIPAGVLAQEQETSLDPRVRLRMFGKMGFYRCDAPYVHVPLGPDREPVDYLDLLFAPWAPAGARAIASATIRQALMPLWARWAPHRQAEALQRFDRLVGDRTVPLLPLI